MNAKQRIRAILRRQPHDRLGWDFLDKEHCDIRFVPGPRLYRPEAEGKGAWGHYPDLAARVPHFRGEVCMDAFGNILGRLEGKTKGECVRGALQDGWEALADYRFPTYDAEEYGRFVRERAAEAGDHYVGCWMPASIFSILRDLRLISNALVDTIEEPENIGEFLNRLYDYTLPMLDSLAQNGADGAMIADDWGTQISPFISPASFEELFAPAYARLAAACHERGLDLVVHSCGLVYPLVGMMVEAGVDGFQFDQPELTGSRVWAEEYGGRAAFYCPVDIQKVLSTGDRALIEKTAKAMCDVFRAHGGNLICKDYPSYGDIGVDPAWARWAEDVIIDNSAL
ncbi:MAG: hypothetical protein IKS52_06375 [Clostridia bacterium]|nr:hypothetical protein [Clostridia bacterium]